MDREPRRRERGQVLVSFPLLILLLFSFLSLVFLFWKVTYEKMRLQAAADASALAMSTFQARALNIIADLNYQLKYPSGDPKRVYPDYSFPGIDQCSPPDYTFPSETVLVGNPSAHPPEVGYLQLIALKQRAQDNFIELYLQLVPALGGKYLQENEPESEVMDSQITPLEFKREKVTVRYRDFKADPTGSTIRYLDDIDGWMESRQIYHFAELTVSKQLEILGYPFFLQAKARAEVVLDSGQLWPDPSPTFEARLTSAE